MSRLCHELEFLLQIEQNLGIILLQILQLLLQLPLLPLQLHQPCQLPSALTSLVLPPTLGIGELTLCVCETTFGRFDFGQGLFVL